MSAESVTTRRLMVPVSTVYLLLSCTVQMKEGGGGNGQTLELVEKILISVLIVVSLQSKQKCVGLVYKFAKPSICVRTSN